MARPSKLSERQWAEVERRLLAGEKPAALAKEYGVDRAAITRKFSQQLRNVKDVANQIVQTDAALKALPVAQQVQAINLADEIKAMMNDLSSAARYSAGTAKMHAKAAHDATSKIMFQSIGEDGETVDPEKLKEHDAAQIAIMKSQQIADMASRIPLKIAEIKAKEKDDDPIRTITLVNAPDEE